MSCRKWLRWVVTQAEVCGITNITIEHGRRHPRLCGVCAGRSFRLTIPRTEGGDWTQRDSIRSQMRRQVKQLTNTEQVIDDH
jgi:hypothetical protein